jgi:hypothetical protein
MQADCLGLEVHLAASIQASFHQILDHFLLAIDRNGAAPGQFEHINAMTAPVEAQLDSMVHQAFALQAFAQAGFDQQIGRALFQHASSHTLFAMGPGAAFKDD